jgi:K+-sensing histidine kinase KdpD
MVAFSVQDSGVGIPEEYQASVFGRFESRSQGSKHRGAGLGLAIVKSIVELHGGQITLRSAPGVGTTVTVLIPQSKQRKPVIDAKPLKTEALPQADTQNAANDDVDLDHYPPSVFG